MPSKKSAPKKKATKKTSDAVVVAVDPNFDKGVQMEEIKLSKREIADFLVEEQEQALSDQLDAINERSSQLNSQLEGREEEKQLCDEIIKEHFSSQLEAAKSLAGEEYVISSGFDCGYADQDFIDQLRAMFGDRSFQKFNYRSNGFRKVTSISLGVRSKSQSKNGRDTAQINLVFDVSEFDSVKALNNKRLEITKQIIANEELLEQKQKEMQSFRKNSRKIKSAVVKSELLKTHSGAQLLKEVESIVNATIALPAPKK